MKRTYAALVLAVAIAVIGVGCKIGTPRVGPGRGTEVVKLRYLAWGDDTEIAMNQHWIAMFRAQHPNIEVDLRTVSGQSFDQVLLTQLAGGIPPDVTYINPASFPNFVHRDAYLDLTPLMERDDVSLDEFLPGLVSPYERDGRVYGLPRSWHPMVIFYNKRLFDRFGAEYPRPTWTWDDFVAAGRKLSVDEDDDGAKEFYGAGNFPMQVFIWSYGGDTFGPKGEFLYDKPESIAGLQLYLDLIYKYGISPSPAQQVTQNPQQMFETGRLGMFALGIWSVPAFRQIERFNWDIAIMPRGPVCRSTLLVTAGWAVTRQSAHPEEAWQLVSFLAGREAQEYQMKIWRDPSPRVDAFKSLMFWEPEKAPASRQVVLDSIEFGRFDSYFIGQPELTTEANRELERLTGGLSTDVGASVAKMREMVERRRQELTDEFDLGAEPSA